MPMMLLLILMMPAAMRSMPVLAAVAGGLSPVLEALVRERVILAKVDMPVVNTIMARARLAARVLLVRLPPRAAPVLRGVCEPRVAAPVVRDAARRVVV